MQVGGFARSDGVARPSADNSDDLELDLATAFVVDDPWASFDSKRVQTLANIEQRWVSRLMISWME